MILQCQHTATNGNDDDNRGNTHEMNVILKTILAKD
jgi:hypothetical protein